MTALESPAPLAEQRASRAAADLDRVRASIFVLTLGVSFVAALIVLFAPLQSMVRPDRVSLVQGVLGLWSVVIPALYLLFRRWPAATYLFHTCAAFGVLAVVIASVDGATSLEQLWVGLTYYCAVLVEALVLLSFRRLVAFEVASILVMAGFVFVGAPNTAIALSIFVQLGGFLTLTTSASLLMERFHGETRTLQMALSRHNEKLEAEVAERARVSEEQQRQLFHMQKMDAVGRLAGGVAHDFNNLLGVILTYARLAKEGLRAGDPVIGDLAEVTKASERAVALTRQLLAFGRKQVLEPTSLDLNEVLGDLEKMLRRLIGENIDFAFEPAPVLRRVLADRDQFGQVVLNLVVNARDAMPTGGKVTVKTLDVVADEAFASRHAGMVQGPFVVVSVTDTGIGIDEATKARLFEPFFTTKGLGKGTGLGLATVYGIVQQSGGHLAVDSAPGCGATFHVYLPASADEPPPKKAPPSVSPSPDGQGQSILVVEDDDGLRGAVRRILARSGYVAYFADSGEEALRVLAQHAEIALLLTDVVMPGMNGKALFEQAVVRHPGLKVLYMSGYTDEVLGPHGVLDPGVQLITKPFTKETVLLLLQETLAHPLPAPTRATT